MDLVELEGINLQSKDNPQYSNYTDRMETFKTWPKAMPIKAKDLCSAGFYYTGLSDKVKCFYCGLGLNEWNAIDIPLAEHEKHAPNCGFVQLMLNGKEEEKQTNDNICVCKICLVNISNILCVPCKHIPFCNFCAVEIQKCPICRVVIDKYITVYIV
jgi:hypothetical protein